MTGGGREVAVLLGAAGEWRLLSLLLSRPREGWRDEIAALSREVRDPALRGVAEEVGTAGEGAYHALLGPGGPASPREAAHVGFGDPGRVLADLAARYAAFGFTPREEEPDDHLAVECDFASYLFLKEAYALAAGNEANAAIARDARERFLSDHAAVVGKRFAARVPEGAPSYLRTAARALAARLPEVAEVADTDPGGEPLECGCPAVTPAGPPTCPAPPRAGRCR